jgi:flagellar motor switch protein FliM
MMTDTSIDDRQWERCDFRRPTKLSREQVRSLDLFHDTFCRRLSSSISSISRATASVEIARVSQLSWDEYVRTLPAFTFLATAAVRPLQGEALVEMDTPMALGMANRLLGGAGRIEPPRRPTELEVPPLRRIGAAAVDALGDALCSFVQVESELVSIDLSPQLVAITSPSQIVLVLTYSLVIQGTELVGDLSVVISLSTMTPMLEKLASHNIEKVGAEVDSALMDAVVRGIPLALEACLSPTLVSAGAIAGLSVGDVLVLDHRLTQPVSVCASGRHLFKAHVGRRGSRLAVSVAETPFPEIRGPRALDGLQSSDQLDEPDHDGPGLHDGEVREQDARVTDAITGTVLAAR